MAKKNIDWIDTDNQRTLQNIKYIDGHQKKNNLKPMTDTIDQKSKSFDQKEKICHKWIDTIGGLQDR
jgi:hypothetical protein